MAHSVVIQNTALDRQPSDLIDYLFPADLQSVVTAQILRGVTQLEYGSRGTGSQSKRRQTKTAKSKTETRMVGLSPLWLYSPYPVAVWDCRRFGVAVLTFAILVCRRFDQVPWHAGMRSSDRASV